MTQAEVRFFSRTTLIQGILLLISVLFLLFTLVYAVNVIVSQTTNSQTREMEKTRIEQVARRDKLLNAQFTNVFAHQEANARRLMALSAYIQKMDETLKNGEIARQVRERREMKRFSELEAKITELQKDHK